MIPTRAEAVPRKQSRRSVRSADHAAGIVESAPRPQPRDDELYGFSVKDTTKAQCVAMLMERYRELVKG